MVEIGRKLNGRYKIIGNVGSGGMANVYLAHDLILNRDVAVKVLRFDFQNDKDAIRRFQREALAATELVHPNIVSVYDVGEDDGMQFLVMEYVRGTDLKRYIAQNYPIPYSTIVQIMKQVLSAMSLAHEHRIIHRDLKPQNILMDEDGNVKITDFGIAIALSETSITQTNTLLGSVHYLSPEQARGGMATRQSDIYAMGIILYELLSGRVPFEGESAVSIALKHFQEEIPSLKEMDPRIPQPLVNVVLHATAKEAVDRYQTAEAMEEDLSTSLSAARMDEPPFVPQAMFEETKMMEPIEPERVAAFKERAEPEEDDWEEEDEPAPKGKKIPKEKNKKSKKGKAWLIAIFAVIAIIAGVIYFLISSAPKEVAIPELKNETVEAATSALEGLNLKVGETIETKEAADDDTIEVGNVVRTNPAAGSKTKEKNTVDIYIKAADGTFAMIDVTGLTSEKATTKLTELGMDKASIKIKEEVNEDIAVGVVISQSVTDGEKVDPKKDTITLTVSKGEDETIVPNVIQSTEADARKTLTDKKLKVNLGTSVYSEEIDAGKVIRTEPPGGESVKNGSTVTLILSKGPEPVASSSSEEPKSAVATVAFSSENPPEDPDAKVYAIQYADASTNYQYKQYNSGLMSYNQILSTSPSVTLQYAEGKPAKVKVTVDGKTIASDENVTHNISLTPDEYE